MIINESFVTHRVSTKYSYVGVNNEYGNCYSCNPNKPFLINYFQLQLPALSHQEATY